MAGGFLGPGPVLCFDLSSRRVHPVSIYNVCVFFLLLLLFSCLVVSDSLHPRGLYSARLLSLHGVIQVRILERVAMPCSRESF